MTDHRRMYAAMDRGAVLARLNTTDRRWYAIRNAADDSGPPVIRIFDEIGFWGVSEEQFAADLAAIDAPEIEVQISSPGGEVFAAIAIYNQLRAHPARIITRVDGIAASAASLIVQAGDHRIMTGASQMMIHAPWGLCIGTAVEMREYADLLDKQGDVIAGIYAARSGGDVADFRELMRTDYYLTDAEAVALGLADEVYEPVRQGDAATGDTTAAVRQRVMAAVRASTTPTPRSTSNGPQGQEEHIMDYAALRAEFGIDSAVTDEEIADILGALTAPDGATDDPPVTTATAEAEGEQPPSQEADTVEVSAAQFTAMQARLATLEEREETRTTEQATAHRDALVRAAVRDGRIAPAEASQYRADLDRAPEVVEAQLERLAPSGRVPLNEIGGAGQTLDDADAEYARITANAPSYR